MNKDKGILRFVGAMAIPNLIALVALSGVIASETRDFKQIRIKEIAEEKHLKSN